MMHPLAFKLNLSSQKLNVPDVLRQKTGLIDNALTGMSIYHSQKVENDKKIIYD